MSSIKSWYLVCDTCGVNSSFVIMYEGPADTENQARKDARKYGWVRIGAIRMPFETAVFDNYAGGVIRMGLYRDEGQAISGHLSACTAVRMSCLELLPAR